ncbi:glucose-6-phosphate isomerase [Labilibacter sediminis]|nr:glucose-6-phosphate isomerase [Labilibacter sediminis]
MKFNPGFEIEPLVEPMGFKYGKDVFGPEVENRTLEAIRKSLKDPNCDGPETVYSIAMDCGKKEHQELLNNMHLLYGVVTYAAGQLGDEPIRSQGHIHSVSPYCNMSTPEVYEIWQGRAIIYMQETAKDNPGRCYAVEAGPGEVVIVPPGWAHATISADPEQPLTFGAWCDREYGFDYFDVRAHKGLAWFPVIKEDGGFEWHRNENYEESELIIKGPESYEDLAIEKGKSIYQLFEENPDRFLYVPKPQLKNDVWEKFVP